MWALLSKEIRSFLSSLIGYVVIGVFLLITGIFLWVYPDSTFNIFINGEASLRHFFSLAPWVFLLLVPAITMRSFAEEKRVGTMELLMTKPITDYQIIFAKFLAGFVLVIISILPTLVYFWCVDDLKTEISAVDTGKMWGSYIGLLFLGGAYVAIGTFASTVSSSQVVAFILGCVMCLFMYVGFDGMSILAGNADSFLLNLGMAEHYRFIGNGLIDTRDLIYFISVIALFIVLTKLKLSARNW